MIFLISGLALWIFAHFFQFVFPETRQRLGMPFKGVVSLLLVFALVLIVVGWRQIDPRYYYAPESTSRLLLIAASFLGLSLFFVSLSKTRINQYLRHPQLTGFIIWSLAHCALNGDSRSLTLFLTMTLWAFAQLLFINHRDGAWTRPSIDTSLLLDSSKIALALLLVSVLFYFHQYLSGIPIH